MAQLARLRDRSAMVPFLLAVPAALGTWIAAYFVYAVFVEGPVRAVLLVPYTLMGALLFGTQIVVPMVAVAAVPLYLAMRWTVGVRLVPTLVAGAVAGLAARWVAGTLWGQPEIRFLPVPVVLAAGVATAYVWWRSWTAVDRSEPGHRGAI